MPASHGSPATNCISIPLTRGEPSARSVARILCACASKAARTRAANSGSSDSTSAKEDMRACCTRPPTKRRIGRWSGPALVAAPGGGQPAADSLARCLPITMRWIWLVPSKICMTFASRM